jgi:hypothetical protein
VRWTRSVALFLRSNKSADRSDLLRHV